MHAGYFVTGTDTDVGKTLCALALMEALKQQGLTVAGMKPVSAGCYQTAEGFRNADADKLLAASSKPFTYQTINPYAFEPAIAPHIAAEQLGVEMQIGRILEHYKNISAQVDRVVVEGAGGWLVPLNSRQSLADVACALKLPVIIVVGMRVGCINHAMLTYCSIQAAGINVAGWIANQIDGDMASLNENINCIARKFNAPLLGVIPFDRTHDSSSVLNCFDLRRIKT